MVRKSQYRHLLKMLKSGFSRVNIEQDMAAIQKLTITAKKCMDMIAGLQVSSIVVLIF